MYIRYQYLVDHRSADCGSTVHVIFMFNCNKARMIDVTDRLYHCNSPQLLASTVFLPSSSKLEEQKHHGGY